MSNKKSYFELKQILKGLDFKAYDNNEQIKYLITNTDIRKPDEDYSELVDKALIFACQKGNMEIVKYTLTSDLLPKKANILATKSTWNGFMWASQEGHLEIVKFLSTFPELNLKDTIDGYLNVLIEVYQQQQTQISNFFLYDLNIQVYKADWRYLKQHMSGENFTQLINDVDKRDMFLRLNDDFELGKPIKNVAKKL